MKVYILDALRAPVGKLYGSLRDTRPDDLAAWAINNLLHRNKDITIDIVAEVCFGCGNQAGEDSRNVARMAVLLSQLDKNTPAVTVNRLCASGIEALIQTARAVRLGESDIYMAGGVESMSRSPYVVSRTNEAERHDSMIGWRFTNPFFKETDALSMGQTAELLALQFNISRKAQDKYALQSQQKYAFAAKNNLLQQEIVPITLPNKHIFDTDEQPRLLNIDVMAALKSPYATDGSVTLANSSSLNDGVAACAVVSERFIKKHKLQPLVEVVAYAIAATSPNEMGISGAIAAKKLLAQADLSINDIDIIELNEAFAAQAIACIDYLNADAQKVNILGGSIAVGNPMAMGSMRLVVSLAHQLHQSTTATYGLAITHSGLGVGIAVLLKKAAI